MPPETEDEHYRRMHRQYGEGLTDDQHSVVYGFAYRKGHSAGFYEVEVEYKDAAEFAFELLKA
jgi:hypothetical protein